MNSLSWLLYVAQAADSFRGMIGAFASFWTACGVISLIVWTVYRFIVPLFWMSDLENSLSWKRNEEAVQKMSAALKSAADTVTTTTYKSAFKAMIFIWILAALSHIIATVLPDRKTVTLIAASEIGARVLNNEKVQGVVDPSIDLLKSYMEKETLANMRDINKLRSEAKAAVSGAKDVIVDKVKEKAKDKIDDLLNK